MKKILLTSLAVAATLASCEKTTLPDSSAHAGKNEIKFAPYAGASTTKGKPVNSNADFKGEEDAYGSFKVAAYVGEKDYFNFSTVTYNGSTWDNTEKMYWPNADGTLHFGGYYPVGAAGLGAGDDAPAYSYASDAHSLTFGYTVDETVTNQVDLMYTLTDHTYTAPTGDELTNDTDAETANLHFKHALTQIGFTATKADEIDVKVKSITICNVVDNGKFVGTISTNHNDNSEITDGTATNDEEVVVNNLCKWELATKAALNAAKDNTTNLENYAVAMGTSDALIGESGEDNAIEVADGAGVTTLTSSTDVLMLLPQTLEAWKPTGTNAGTESYLAIDCEITHADKTAPIISGVIYVPFSTADITYTPTNNYTDNGKGAWLPGHKITYNLKFGGGYTDPTGPTTPLEPGETPEPGGVIPALRLITYTVSVDEWIPVTAPEVSIN